MVPEQDAGGGDRNTLRIQHHRNVVAVPTLLQQIADGRLVDRTAQLWIGNQRLRHVVDEGRILGQHVGTQLQLGQAVRLQFAFHRNRHPQLIQRPGLRVLIGLPQRGGSGRQRQHRHRANAEQKKPQGRLHGLAPVFNAVVMRGLIANNCCVTAPFIGSVTGWLTGSARGFQKCSVPAPPGNPRRVKLPSAATLLT